MEITERNKNGRALTGLCEVCGTEVELGHFTCTCEKCGADYNWGGQRLANREQWGEETGESLSNILRIK